LDALARNVTRAVGLGPEDTVLVTLPLCHSYAIDFAVLGAVASGSAQEIHDRFLPARAAAALLSGRITVWPAVPLMLDAVSRNAREESARLARTRVISAGSPLPPRVRHRFEAAFGARVAQLYGASEFGAIAYSPPEAEGFDPAAVGRPFEGVTFRVVKPGQSEAREPLAVGSEGEVWVRAPSAMDRYLDAPDRPDAEGYWTTGDLGRLDAHGALHVTGRVKSLIDVGGRQVNPLEVEAVLARHPAVTEAVVVGTAFSDTAARLKAIIVPQPGQSPSSGELRAFAREHLAAHKIPRSFELRSELPRSAAGKVLRQKLADEADEVPR
jgi:acyl-CoA synthetase (AMP-forming)/AMP-acid ligase II